MRLTNILYIILSLVFAIGCANKTTHEDTAPRHYTVSLSCLWECHQLNMTLDACEAEQHAVCEGIPPEVSDGQ